MRWLPLLLLLPLAGCARPVTVGAKKFTESVILAEMGTQLARAAGTPAERSDLGGTPALWRALLAGDIDAYPEYTGTITADILKASPPDLAAALAPYGVRVSRPLGFRNNYALGMRKDVAAARGITKTSDLRGHADLRCGFIPEFLDRADGWPGLKPHYRLPQTSAQGMAHAVAYRALVEGAIDVTEVYTTDGEIARYDLLVLPDDEKFFPAYEAVWLYRADLETRHPAVVASLRRLEGRIDEPRMQRMNAAAQDERNPRSEGEVAAEFVRGELGAVAEASDGTLAGRVLQTTGEHLLLVLPSLLAAVLAGVPLGVLAARRPLAGKVVLAVCGLLQTIPSLALLLFMIPLMKGLVGQGTGAPPAVAALFLYALLPVVRNTPRRPHHHPRLAPRVGRGAGPAGVRRPVAGGTAAGRPHHPGRGSHRGGHHRRHRHPGRVHRRGRVRPADPPRHRQVQHPAHARRGDPGGGAGPCSSKGRSGCSNA